MENEYERLKELIAYIKDGIQDGYPFEVTGEDSKLVLKALEHYLAAQNRRAD